MLKTRPSIQELLERIRELEQELEKERRVETELSDLEQRYAVALKDLDNRTREIYAIRSIVNMPQLYLDEKLNIVGYSGDFLLLTINVIEYARNRTGVTTLFNEGDYQKIKEHLDRIKALEDLPFDKGNKWRLRYRGPALTERIGADWIIYRDVDRHWRIVERDGVCKIVHHPHVKDSLDCCIMSAGEYGGAREDVRLRFKVGTSRKSEYIRDLTAFVSGTSGREAIIPDINGYTICLGSNYNSLGRIQKQGADVVSRTESLDPQACYQVEVERTGGKISRKLWNLDSGEEIPVLEYVDHHAIYDRQNHIGFYTYSGEAEFYDIEVFTRQSQFDIEQFRLPFHIEAEIRDPKLAGRIFGIKYARHEIMGRPLHTLILEDITESKKSDEALRESEEKYRKLFEEGRVARSTTTVEGKFIDTNPEMLNLFGCTQEEIQQVNAYDLYVNPEDREVYLEVLKKQGFVQDYEIKFKKKDGTKMDCLVNSTVHRDSDGKIFCIQGSIHDITERKRIEAQLKESQKMEVIGRLASGVAHEVRNPLNAILAITEALIQEIGDSPVYKPYLDHIRTQVDRLSTLMKDLLELGKPLKKDNLLPCSVNAICAEAIELWGQSTGGQDGGRIHLRDNTSSGGLLVQGDSTKLKQVLFNLFENAAQHSPGNSEITVGISDPGDGQVCVRVSDRGTGIAPEIMSEVFKPFFTTRARGSGLGLSIVNNIVETHGGRIKLVNNDPPPGLTVEVYLPRCEDNAG